MLDNDITLFDLHIDSNGETTNPALVIKGCNAVICNDRYGSQAIYSELEESSLVYLNKNDYKGNALVLEIEICFSNNQRTPYHWFWARCFSIRTDNGLVIKVNGEKHDKAQSKINKDSMMVLGIGLFISNEQEYETLLNCNILLIEGFVALDRATNTYGVAIKLQRKKGEWEIIFANTFRENKKDNIKNKNQ